MFAGRNEVGNMQGKKIEKNFFKTIEDSRAKKKRTARTDSRINLHNTFTTKKLLDKIYKIISHGFTAYYIPRKSYVSNLSRML